jgi:hypothetical protein
LMIILHLDDVAVHFDIGFALVNLNVMLLRVKFVEAGPRAKIRERYLRVVLRARFRRDEGPSGLFPLDCTW